MTRVALFGGTFDPVHYGHLLPVDAAREELALDSVLMLPNPWPPHKLSEPLTPYVHRKEMLRLALAEFPHLTLANYEEQAVGPGYTSDTVRRVIADLGPGERELWLIIGADSLVEMPRWKDPESLFRDVRVAVMPRPGVDLTGVPERYRERVRLLGTPLLAVSATDIRHRLRMGLEVAGLMPVAAIEYVRHQGLYLSETRAH
jgi:nicotinate-nucleotide adenylyltransferase